MNNCQNCQACSPETATIDLTNGGGFVLVGNLNVGKSTLFSKMKGGVSSRINVPGSTVTIKSGFIKGSHTKIFVTPGIYSIFSNNEDERASRDLFLDPASQKDIQGIILVADAKNLKRSIAIALQYAEYSLPTVLCLNMVDEASSRGIEIDIDQLADTLGVEVFSTIATNGMGVDELINGLSYARIPAQSINYPDHVEEFLMRVSHHFQNSTISTRAVGLLLLAGDIGVRDYIYNNFGKEMFQKLTILAEDYKNELATNAEITLGTIFNQEAAKIVNKIVKTEPPNRNPLILNFGDWCTKLTTGIPIALGIVTLMYLFVGTFGATYLVDTINHVLFEKYITPFITNLINPIPIPFVRDMIIDPDFGVLPTGIFLALGLVLPVIFCFYLAFGVLEDSGYLPRISLLLDRIFQTMGLNGKGVIPLVMGFSCVTMAILTTRVLNSEKEKNIASFLLFLCMPCAPLLAVMLIILDKMPLSATLFVFGIILLQILIAGFLANKILPGTRSPLMMEIPAMRIPKLWPLFKMASAKSYFFMKEAIPVFVYASMAVFIFQRLGGLTVLEDLFSPIIGKIIGLPEKSIQVFIKTMIRRESGAAELEHLSNGYTNLQLVVNLLVMTFIAPCLNAIIVLYKERGGKAASAIMFSVTLYAIIIGSLVNHISKLFGITFT